MNRFVVQWTQDAAPTVLHSDAPAWSHAPSQSWIVADARLDYVDDLRRSLDIPPAADVGDAELLLRAYLAWGTAFADRIDGDFACAIWDGRRGKLILARDLFGVRELFYATSSSLSVGTSIGGLLTHTTVSERLDLDLLREIVNGNYESYARKTVRAAIRRVPTDAMLEVGAGGTSMVRVCRSQLRGGPEVSLDDGIAQVRDVLSASVASRLRQAVQPAVWLSGGLDSATIATIALRQTQASSVITGYTAIFDDHPTADERTYVDALLRENPGLRSRRIVSDATNGFSLVATDDEPDFDSLRGLLQALTDPPARDGCDVAMTGLWADQLLLSHAYYLPELLRDLSWLQRRQEWHHFWSRRSADWRWFARIAIPRRGHVSVRARAVTRAFFAGVMQANLSYMACLRRSSGIDFTFPYLDRRLLLAVLALPAEGLFADGVNKVALRLAFSGLLPEETVERSRSHGHFSHLERTGFDARRARFSEWRSDSKAVELGLLTRRALDRRWSLVAPAPSLVPAALNQWLLVEAWLRTKVLKLATDNQKR